MSYDPGVNGISGANDVALNNPSNNEVLSFNSALGLWQNKPTFDGTYASLTAKPDLGTAATADIGTGSGQVMAADDARVANRSNLYTIHGNGPRVHQLTGEPLPLPPSMHVRWITADYPAYAVQEDEWDIIGAPAMPQLTVVGSAIDAATSAATTRSITLPPGIQDGDTILVVGVHTGSTSYSTIAGTSGLALVSPDKVQSGHHQYVWIKENASASDSSQTLTMSSFDSGGSPLALWNTVGAVVLRGTPTSNVVDTQNEATGDLSDTTITNPSIASSILACEFAIASATGTTSSPSNAFSTPSGFTQVLSGTSAWTGGGGQTSLWVGYTSLTSTLAGTNMGGHSFTFPVSVGKWARTIPIGAAWS